MKMKKEDFDVLECAMNKAFVKHEKAYSEYMNAGFSEMRFRWDLFRTTGIKLGDGRGMRGDLNLYAYLNDDHIDTALKAITATK